MDSKENEIREENTSNPENKLLADGNNRRRYSTKRTNRLWLWLGVLILIFILIWWLWTMGILGDLTGSFNG